VRPLRTFFSRVRGLVRARQLDRDLQHEIAAHLDEATEEYLRQGLSPTEARRTALRNFGGVTRTEEAYRDAGSFMWVEHLRRDVRHGVRALLRSAGFSFVVLVVLAIGTGAITSVFVLLNTIVLQPLPFPQSDRLVVVKHSAPGLNLDEVGLSSGLYFHYSQRARSLDSLAVYSDSVLNLRVPGSGTERVYVTYAGVALFQVLRAKPALGRLFTEEDGLPGFMNMRWTVPILLSHDFWVGHLGRDPDVVGRILTINENPRRVVGVLPEGFVFPDRHTQIWMLMEVPRATANFARVFNWNAVARLRPGATVSSAQAELGHILPQIVGDYRDATTERLAEVKLSPFVTPLKSDVIGDVAHVLWTLFGGMALLLVIACANAAGLFAVRAEHRRREIAVRHALGAHRRHVARMFFTEALVLTFAAAAFGLLLAKGLLWGVLAFAPVELPRSAEIALDGVAVTFAAGLAVLMAGFYGALSVRRQGWSLTVNLLRGDHGATGNRGGHFGRDPFIVLQVALALTLMAGSALMVKTYRNLSQRDLGFSAERLLTVEFGLPSRKADQHARIYHDVVERVSRLPGVERASAASFVPLTAGEDVYPVQTGATPVAFKFFLPGYFQTMATPILEGDGFDVGGLTTAPYPVLVSAALARRLYPGQRAVGKTVRRLNEDGSIVTLGAGPVPAFTIAGVVGDVRETTLRQGPTEIVYVPVIEPRVEQSITPTNMTLAIRTRIAPLEVGAAVRDAIATVDPGLSVGQVRTMDSIVLAARAREAFVGALLLLAAAVSLFLGVVGIYGSVAHVVTRRTREIGIRMALGARRGEVVRMVVMGSMWTVLAGAALGLVVAFAGTRMLSALLFGVEPRDPAILLAVTAVLLSAAVAAALVAAQRAARVAPVIAIRSE
jgi:putative ABC transport system permease protein